MNGLLEALDTPDGKSQHRVPGSRALVPKGLVQEGHCCHIPKKKFFQDLPRFVPNSCVISVPFFLEHY